MIIALFGVTDAWENNVGWEFYDLDAQLKKYFNDTILNIQNMSFNQHGFDTKKGEVLKQSLINPFYQLLQLQ